MSGIVYIILEIIYIINFSNLRSSRRETKGILKRFLSRKWEVRFKPIFQIGVTQVRKQRKPRFD